MVSNLLGVRRLDKYPGAFSEEKPIFLEFGLAQNKNNKSPTSPGEFIEQGTSAVVMLDKLKPICKQIISRVNHFWPKIFTRES